MAGVDVEKMTGLQEVFNDIPSPFQGLETRYLQEKYYHENLGLVVRILKITIYYECILYT